MKKQYSPNLLDICLIFKTEHSMILREQRDFNGIFIAVLKLKSKMQLIEGIHHECDYKKI